MRHVAKPPDRFNLKIDGVVCYEANNYNTHIAQYSRCVDNKAIKFGQLIDPNWTNIILQRSCKRRSRENDSRPLFAF